VLWWRFPQSWMFYILINDPEKPTCSPRSTSAIGRQDWLMWIVPRGSWAHSGVWLLSSSGGQLEGENGMLPLPSDLRWLLILSDEVALPGSSLFPWGFSTVTNSAPALEGLLNSGQFPVGILTKMPLMHKWHKAGSKGPGLRSPTKWI
jgi:hypothetical protein